MLSIPYRTIRGSVMNEIIKTIFDTLDNLQIKYTYITHEEYHNMEECAIAGKKLGAEFCKNLFLQDRQGREFFLLLLVGDKKFRTAEVSKQISRARLSFGSDEKLSELLKEKGGSINPLGLIFDNNHVVNLLIDSDLKNYEYICFHPSDGHYSLKMRYSDFTEKFLPYVGYTPTYITVSK